MPPLIPINLRACARRAVDFLYPPLCLLCSMPRAAHERWLCDRCLAGLAANAAGRDACPRCAQNRLTHECACEVAWDHPFEQIVSALDYSEDVRRLVHYVKYRGFKELARYLGIVVSAQLPERCFEDIDLAVAVPLHALRRIRRGYNQAEWFAQGLLDSRRSSLPLVRRALRRVRNTRTQTTLSRDQRRRNLSRTFTLTDAHRETFRNKSVLLVDDVVTTGATVGACAQALLDQGCRTVRIVSLARD